MNRMTCTLLGCQPRCHSRRWRPWTKKCIVETCCSLFGDPGCGLQHCVSRAAFHASLLSLAGAAVTIILVATNVLLRQTRVCRDKTLFCRNKSMLVATNTWKKRLSRQKWYLWQLSPTILFSNALIFQMPSLDVFSRFYIYPVTCFYFAWTEFVFLICSGDFRMYVQCLRFRMWPWTMSKS